MISAARFARLELASARVNARQMIVLGVLVAIVAWISGSREPLTFAAIVPLLPIFFVTYPFAADERGRHDLLYATLPVPRRTVVSGRHAYFVVMELGSALLAMALAGASALASDRPLDLGMAAFVTVISATVASILLTVQLPILFWLGFTKSRWIVVLPMVICFSPLVATQLPGAKEQLAALRPETPTPELVAVVSAVLIGVTILAWTTSALISSRLYARRQF